MRSKPDELNWQSKHQLRLAAFPREIREAHVHCNRNCDELLRSSVAGCFFWCLVFASSTIDEWVDDDESGHGQTALCPRCGIDSVIGDRSGVEISEMFMSRMKEYWF